MDKRFDFPMAAFLKIYRITINIIHKTHAKNNENILPLKPIAPVFYLRLHVVIPPSGRESEAFFLFLEIA